MANKRQLINWALQAGRELATASKAPTRERKVAILGAGGGIGQPLSMLMKVRTLPLYLLPWDSHCSSVLA